MSWSGTNTAMFRTWPLAVTGQGQTAAVLPAAYAGLGADTVDVALYNNTGTPDKDATLATSAYNAGQWVTANEVADGTNWHAGGEPLTAKTLTNPSTGVMMFDAADTPQAGATTTLANVYGCLVYDATITAGTGGVAKEGVSFHDFGGVQSVTAGTFSIVWHSNGLWRISV